MILAFLLNCIYIQTTFFLKKLSCFFFKPILWEGERLSPSVDCFWFWKFFLLGNAHIVLQRTNIDSAGDFLQQENLDVFMFQDHFFLDLFECMIYTVREILCL